MKQNKRRGARVGVLLGLCAALTVTALAASNAGTERDPLVTLSYLNETFMGNVLQRVDQKIQERDRRLSGGIGGSAVSGFTLVDLTAGQTLYGGIGCEVMLRVGSAACVAASAPGLIDETDGTTLNGGGALVKNHLYMMTIEDRGVKATAGTVKLLVRGSYRIG